jgi:hypothetical protein
MASSFSTSVNPSSVSLALPNCEEFTRFGVASNFLLGDGVMGILMSLLEDEREPCELEELRLGVRLGRSTELLPVFVVGMPV